MVIPREANMVRLYIQIASSTDADWNPRKSATTEEVQAAAKKILNPYWIEWDRVEWYSVYPIGQGIADRYTLDERVFMGGDCCHTHSPKAGQGMNTAFLDAQNLAWKIHHVEAGFADRSILKSYEAERRLIADNLLNFDAKYAKLFSQRQPSAGEVGAVSQQKAGNGAQQPEENEFMKTFKESCEFTSGYGVAYNENIFNWSESHPAKSPLFLSEKKGQTTQRTGRIMTPATVTRVADANVVHLEQEIPLNGSYRIYLFGGKHSKTKQAITDFAVNIFAGSDTTAISTRSIIYYLLKNPQCKQKLVEEIDTLRRQGQLSDPVTLSEADKMPYLQAVMYEALRMHPAVGMSLPRTTPQGGATVAGRYIPAGTVVGANPWVVHRNKEIYGDDVESFRPERWMTEKNGDMHRFFFAFGSGARMCEYLVTRVCIRFRRLTCVFQAWAGTYRGWRCKPDLLC